MVKECSWMSGICFSFYHSTYCCGDFKRSPPLISLFCQSAPKCRLPKNPASPRGKPRTQKPLVITIQRTTQLRRFRVAKLATPTGASAFICVLPKIQGCGRLRASPTGAAEIIGLYRPAKRTPSGSEPRTLCAERAKLRHQKVACERTFNQPSKILSQSTS